MVSENKGIFHPKFESEKGFRNDTFSQAPESTQCFATRVFFHSLFPCNFDNQFSQNCVTGFYFMHVRIYTNWGNWSLKTDTFRNCQRPVFSLGVSQYVICITNLWKIELHLNWLTKFKKIMEEKNTLVAQVVCFQMLEFKTFSWGPNILMRNYSFLKNYVTSEGANSHNVFKLSLALFMLLLNLIHLFITRCFKSVFFFSKDERNCQSNVCAEDQYRCPSGKCIPNYWICDTSNDCPDGADESKFDCQGRQCSTGQFRCNTGMD